MEQEYNTDIIKRLINSIDSLEEAISMARTTLSNKGLGSEYGVETRFSSYDEIIMKQRCLIEDLKSYILEDNKLMTGATIERINVFSQFIADDSKYLLAQITKSGSSLSENEIN